MAGNAVVIKIKGDDSHYLSTLKGLGNATATAMKKMTSGIASAVKGVGTVSAGIATAWSAVGLSAVKYNSDIEQLQTSFEVMTGSGEKGAEVLERIRKLGATTPFEMQGLAETTQLLMNYNLTADDALAKMTMLGDISQGDQTKLTRIATAYGQMSSAGKVMLEDVKQMIEAGFNPLVEISETTGESMASLYDRISKGTLAVDEITASMERSTSAGGKYYQSMLKQSQTLNGQLSTLKDNAQQLGGNIFGFASDGLRESILPEANRIVEELNDAFTSGGMDGLSDALAAQTPKVISTVAGMAHSALSGVTKQMPKLLNGLISALPSVLSSGGMIASDLTTALFDMTAVAVEGIVARLPELVPALIQGVVGVGESVLKGAFNVLGGLGRGLEDAMKDVGLLSKTPDDLLDEWMHSYDPNKINEIKPTIEINPEVSVDESRVQLDSVYDMIAEQLTDGLADTPEVVDNLKEQVKDYYNTQIEQVNAWKEETLSQLSNTLPEDEYAEAAAKIEAEASSMVTALQAASDETLTFIDNNAGKSTEAVEANLGELERIYQAAVGYRDKVAALTGEAGSMAERQREVVASGNSKDTNTQYTAIMLTAAQYEQALKDAEEKKNAALQEALALSEQGIADYAAQEEAILATYEQEQAKAQETLQADMAQLWTGIGAAMAPDAQEMLQTISKQAEVAQQARELLQKAFEGELLSETDLTDDMVKLMGLEGIDVAELVKAAMGDEQQLSAAIQGALQSILTSGEEIDFQPVLDKIFADVPEDTHALFDKVLQEGLLNGLEEIDLTDNNAMLNLLGGLMPSNEEAISIGKPAGEAVGQAAVDGMEGAADGATTAGNEYGEGFADGLEQKRAKVMATARSIANSATAAIRSALQIRSPSRVAMQLGAYTGEGFDLGLKQSLRSAVRNAENIVGGLNLSPKLTAPDLSGAFTAAADIMTAGYDRPMYLTVNGRVVGQVLANDTARAANWRNRNIAMGVGK